MPTIDKNVPVPVPARGRPRIYPWATMKPGDSFYLGAGTLKRRITLQKSVRATGAQWFRRHRPEYTITSSRDAKGVRFWLVPVPEVKQ